MHVPAGHRFPDATAVAFASAWARHRCLQLYLLLGPKPERRRALLFSSGFFFFFFFFIDYPGIFGGLNMVKNS